MQILEIQSVRRTEAIDITDKINEMLSKSDIKNGICVVFIPHTTAAVTINENADPSVMKDFLNYLDKIVPLNEKYTHSEGNSHAHIKASIIGSDRNIIVENGKLKLGRWQGIFFLEFDGPRRREVLIEIIKTD